MPLSHTLREIRVGLGILLVSVLLLVPVAARGEGEDPAVVEKITNLNKKALDAYDALEFEDARKLLKQALDLCISSGLDKHPIRARTHVHMGVVLIAAKQQELGIKQFRKALEIQPDIQVTKALANPEIIQAFEEAAASPPVPIDPGGTEPTAPGPSAPPESKPPPPAPPPQAPADIIHAPISRGKRGRSIPVTATVSPDLTGYTKLVMGYRAAGGQEFIGIDMQRAGNRFTAEIPPEATKGNTVSYFIEAEAEDESPVATSASEEKPYSISLSEGGGDEDEESGEDEEGPKLFVGLLGGSGLGYATGNGEVNADNKVNPGFAPSSAAQIVPEVGYFLLPGFRLSLQVRYQVVSGTTPLNLKLLNPPRAGCGSDQICTAASGAIAVFARGTWFFGSGTFRPYFSGAFGAGEIRHVVKFTSLTPICGMNGGEACVDTVVAGPIFGGVGGGALFSLTPTFGLVVELNSLLGLPKFTVHFDVNAGVAVRL